jgi:hypothetical protein
MPGDIYQKERSIITLTTGGGSLTTGTAGLGNGTANLDCRSAGNAPQDLLAQFEFIAQWATVTGIAAGTVVADLFLVPALDGTNFPAVNTTSGSSNVPAGTYVTSFVATQAPTANTDMRFVSEPVPLLPLLYRPYILNRSGQTITANWDLFVVTARGQYS